MNNPFGTFAIIGKHNKVNIKMEHFFVNGGSEGLIDGIKFLGQMSIHNANIEAKNISMIISFSDDGINIRNSNVNISYSNFSNNLSDQVDLDFCEGILFSNTFVSKSMDKSIPSNGDGIDLSGSLILLKNNNFSNFSDKAVSIGEESKALLDNNQIISNNIGIAIKDGSKAFILSNNTLKDNTENYSLYTKKPFYPQPEVFIDRIEGNFTTNEGIIREIDSNQMTNLFGEL